MKNHEEIVKLKHVPKTYEERNELFKHFHKELHLGQPIDPRDCGRLNCGEIWSSILHLFPIPS